MKLLMIYSSYFSYRTTTVSLPEAERVDEESEFHEVQLALIQMEAHDEQRPPLKKSCEFIKWLSRKHPFNTVILHSFSHLSDSKAPASFAASFLNQMEDRLRLYGFEVFQTPYGYFLDLQIKAPGFSLARVFKSF